jgi:hypothetical protein
MGFLDDLNRFAGHLIRGDLGGALGDLGLNAGDASSPPQTGGMSPVQIGNIGAGQKHAESERSNQSSLTASTGGAAHQNCCNRFTFDSGFLVDGANGRVWQLNTTTNTLDEVTFNNNNAKQGLVDSLVESKLSSIRCRYEREELATVAPSRRKALLAQFEKDHLDPLRAAAQAVTY